MRGELSGGNGLVLCMCGNSRGRQGGCGWRERSSGGEGPGAATVCKGGCSWRERSCGGEGPGAATVCKDAVGVLGTVMGVCEVGQSRCRRYLLVQPPTLRDLLLVRRAPICTPPVSFISVQSV